MNNYIDKYSRYHDKPVPDSGEPSSNNSWIYSAYAKKAGLPVDLESLNRCFHLCRYNDRVVNGVNVSIARSPDKFTPPISRDEILGLASLGIIHKVYIPDWNFSPFIVPKFSLIKLVKQLSQLITTKPMSAEGSWSHLVGPFYTKHRNYFWMNNLDQIYRFAFSVPVQDRHFILKCWDKFQWYNPVHLFYAAISGLDRLGRPSGIRWLKYSKGGQRHRSYVLASAMVEEFPEDHPIRQKLGL